MKKQERSLDSLSVRTQKLIAIVKNFTRINEYFHFSIILTLIGQFTALKGTELNWTTLALVAFINTLNVAFSFMINDIEDAEEDALDPKKIARNPISGKLIKENVARYITFAIIPISIGLSVLVNPHLVVVTVINIVIGFLYSWKKVRLKNIAVLDAISHALFLSVLLFVGGYVSIAPITLNQFDIPFWLIVLGAFVASISGSLANQYRDYEVDRLVSLKSSSSYIKKNTLKVIMLVSLVLGAGLLLTGSLMQVDVIKALFASLIAAIINLLLYITYLFLTKKRGVEYQRIMEGLSRVAMTALVFYFLF